ncbi:hypothetical protein, partial [Egicoccus sp. AB-alg2]|uniref:hypothetical protein n=1 Tax=Egicoccus sp. AB-alg2 TaxID=3242693 RepID=UPI00359D198A
LREALAGDPEPERVQALIAEADRFGVTLDTDGLAHAFGQALTRLTRRVRRAVADDDTFATFGPEQARVIAGFTTLVEIAESLPFEVDLAQAQNLTWQVRRQRREWLETRAGAGDEAARAWADAIDALTERLGFALR